jgi:hypothetical protein
MAADVAQRLIRRYLRICVRRAAAFGAPSAAS